MKSKQNKQNKQNKEVTQQEMEQKVVRTLTDYPAEAIAKLKATMLIDEDNADFIARCIQWNEKRTETIEEIKNFSAFYDIHLAWGTYQTMANYPKEEMLTNFFRWCEMRVGKPIILFSLNDWKQAARKMEEQAKMIKPASTWLALSEALKQAATEIQAEHFKALPQEN